MLQTPLFPGSFLRVVLSALLLAALPAPASAKSVRTDYVESELVARTSALEPGSTVLLGLRLKMDPHWHTYWQNPGDSGMPTTIQWKLPAGFKAGPVQWPQPQRLPVPPLMNYGYEGEIVLPVEITVPKDGLLSLLGRPARLAARADWLVCKDVCLPGGADLELTLPVVQGNPAPDARWAALFDKALASMPVRALTGAVAATVDGMIELTLPGARLLPSAPSAPKGVYVFPTIEGLVEHAAPQTVRETADGLVVRLAVIHQLVASEPRMAGIVTGIDTRPVSFDAPMSGKLVPGKGLPAGLPAELPAASAAASTGVPFNTAAASISFGLALLFAFIGGAILNLMPCVFPVLSLKILGFARGGDSGNAGSASGGTGSAAGTGGTGGTGGTSGTSGTSHRAMRTHGIAFAIGVIGSFVALAAVLLGLRAAGEAVGWGFQLQSPLVVTLLALLFFVIGLNLSGVFEFGSVLPGGVAGATLKHPTADALLSGVLAALVASPCTAPFMGAALGFALTQSTAAALTVFAVMGAGMALPYVLLSWFPAWLKRLPRPGPWLVTFKQAMAFPMYATVVWLAWVLLVQVGVDGLVGFGSALVVVAFGAWLLGKSQQVIVRLSAVGAILTALVLANPPTPTVLADGVGGNVVSAASGGSGASGASGASGTATAGASASGAQNWSAYSKTGIAEHNASGRAVFVDFTAAWCVTCQVNKKVVLETASMQNAFRAKKLVLMRADWTRRDPAITAALAEFGRNGVPVYALYAPGKAPVLLPELLTERIVLDALKSL